MTPPPESLLAGAADRHGRHERAEGWDRQRRLRAPERPDALAYGRHAARPADRTQETP